MRSVYREGPNGRKRLVVISGPWGTEAVEFEGEITECPFCGGEPADHYQHNYHGAYWDCPEPLTPMEELAAVPLED